MGNPFFLEREKFLLSIQPWKFRSWSNDWQSDIGFSVSDKNSNEYIKLSNQQIAVIWDLMNTFWFKIDKVERLLDSEFTKILLKPEDQIEILSSKNESNNRQDPIHIIPEPWNMTDTFSFLDQAITQVVREWWGSIMSKVVYNGDEKKYISFCDALAVSINSALNKDIDSI